MVCTPFSNRQNLTIGQFYKRNPGFLWSAVIIILLGVQVCESVLLHANCGDTMSLQWDQTLKKKKHGGRTWSRHKNVRASQPDLRKNLFSDVSANFIIQCTHFTEPGTSAACRTNNILPAWTLKMCFLWRPILLCIIQLNITWPDNNSQTDHFAESFCQGT